MSIIFLMLATILLFTSQQTMGFIKSTTIIFDWPGRPVIINSHSRIFEAYSNERINFGSLERRDFMFLMKQTGKEEPTQLRMDCLPMNLVSLHWSSIRIKNV